MLANVTGSKGSLLAFNRRKRRVAEFSVETRKPPAALAGGGLCVARTQNFWVRLLFPRASWRP